MWIERNIPSSFLFFVGLSVIPTILLQNSLFIKTGQILFFIILCFLSKKRIRIIRSLVFLFVTAGLNLLSPFGRVLFRFYGLLITQGALQNGLNKGLTLIGLMYVSRFSIRSDLRLPGGIGRLMSMVFFYIDRLSGQDANITARRFVKSIDHVLSLAHHSQWYTHEGIRLRLTVRGAVALVSLFFFNWGCLVMSQILDIL